jgi:hypothetical protein
VILLTIPVQSLSLLSIALRSFFVKPPKDLGATESTLPADLRVCGAKLTLIFTASSALIGIPSLTVTYEIYSEPVIRLDAKRILALSK